MTDLGTRIRLEVIASDDELAAEGERIKTIIPSYNAEKISHSIFCTAKEKLKIFWSAETMKAIVESFDKEKIGQRTLELIEKS